MCALFVFFLCILRNILILSGYSLAWLTVWPADVIKTQRQSGNYEGKSTAELLKINLKSGRLFRGILPGLFRSTVANGSSMVIYEKVHTGLTNYLDLERKDMT